MCPALRAQVALIEAALTRLHATMGEETAEMHRIQNLNQVCKPTIIRSTPSTPSTLVLKELQVNIGPVRSAEL